MGRVIESGACSYTDLLSGKVSIRDFFEILRILDWNNYAQAVVQNRENME